MSKLKSLSSFLFACGIGAIATSATAAYEIPASDGFPDDVTQVTCFQRDWANPSMVHYDGCAGSLSWWNMPVPIFSTGSSMSVYVKSQLSGNECYAEVMRDDGSLVNWNYQPFNAVNKWINFAALSVGSNQSAIVQCTISSASGDYLASVKGF